MDYRIILIGDTHYDTATEVYHSDYNEPDERLNRIQRAEFERNAKLWSGASPQMMAAAGRRTTDKTSFVIQVGDLIQGDCGNPAVHSRMLLDALALFKKNFGTLPFLTVTGNHDVRGPQAAEAYRETAPAYHARELNMDIRSTTFYFRHGKDLFLFIDFTAPDEDVIREAFNVHADARHKFVVSHGPVVASDCYFAAWMLFGYGNTEKRAAFRKLFAANNVIVLTGHSHTVEYQVYEEDGGTIRQIIMNSVWELPEQKNMTLIHSDPAEYGVEQPRYNRPVNLPVIDEYRPGIRHYARYHGAGYATLDIGDEVTVHYYGGDSDDPAVTFTL